MSNEFIDGIIRKYFENIKTKNNATCIFKRRLKKLPLLSNYIDNRYYNSDSWTETIWRIRNNINNKPYCKNCGKELKFPFKIYCSCKCRSNNKEVINKSKQTCLKKYGVEYSINNKLIQENIQKKLASQRKEISIKSKKTKLEKYGNENYVNPQKAKQTKLKKYGDKNYTNQKQRELTNIQKYGYKTPLLNNKIINKSKQTKLEKYGDENYVNPQKAKQTCLEKYGVDNVFKSTKIKNKIKETCLEKYGDENYRNIEKHKQTCLEKYGVTSYTQTEEFKQRIDWKQTNIKQILTKKKNNTLNTSKPESKSYLILKEKYPDIKTQYISKEYPYHCDFYIPSLDLYIECNYHWTHGGHEFNNKNIKDIEKLNLWKSKNSKFYNQAIYVWTELDINKRKIAKENNLNFIEIWNINDIYKI